MSQKITITAKILNAARLPRMDLVSMIDPYVKVICGDQSARTTVKSDDPAPSWRETLTLEVEAAQDAVCRVEVWDKDTFKDDFVGHLEFSVAAMQANPIKGEHVVALADGVEPSEWGAPVLRIHLSAA